MKNRSNEIRIRRELPVLLIFFIIFRKILCKNPFIFFSFLLQIYKNKNKEFWVPQGQASKPLFYFQSIKIILGPLTQRPILILKFVEFLNNNTFWIFSLTYFVSLRMYSSNIHLDSWFLLYLLKVCAYVFIHVLSSEKLRYICLYWCQSSKDFHLW